MSNLLTEQKMKALQSEFRDRFVMVGALALLSSALFATLMLLPSYLVLVTSEPADNGALEQAKEDQQGIDVLKHSQALLREVAGILAASSSPSRAFTQAVLLRPRGVTLNQFSYQVSQMPGQQSNLTISGAGTSRDAINGYRDALMHSGKFPTVSIPVSAIVGASEGGGFTATLTSTN